jgi:hypothetical protein
VTKAAVDLLKAPPASLGPMPKTGAVRPIREGLA